MQRFLFSVVFLLMAISSYADAPLKVYHYADANAAPDVWAWDGVLGIDEYGDTAWIGGSLYDTYMAIQADLEAGLKLVSDEYYSVPRYHFNVKAAHAFAARFYLYKREWAKVVEHADYVLTTSDETVLSLLYDAQKTS